MKTIVLLFKIKMITLPTIPNVEDIISINEPNINNKSQDFEPISNHSTKNIIDKTNANDKT